MALLALDIAAVLHVLLFGLHFSPLLALILIIIQDFHPSTLALRFYLLPSSTHYFIAILVIRLSSPLSFSFKFLFIPSIVLDDRQTSRLDWVDLIA